MERTSSGAGQKAWRTEGVIKEMELARCGRRWRSDDLEVEGTG